MDLQHQNHWENLTADCRDEQGFVTVRHSLEMLEQMNARAPQIIAKFGEQVIGYALVFYCCKYPRVYSRVRLAKPLKN